MRKFIAVFAAVCISVSLGIEVLPLSAQDARPAAANSCLSIPSSAFAEEDNSYEFTNSFRLALSSGSGSFRAPVQVPNGSRFKKIRLICWDNGASVVYAALYRLAISQNAPGLGTVTSSGSDTSYRVFNNTAISPRLVNNFKYSYYVRVDLPGTNVEYRLGQVKILYDAP